MKAPATIALACIVSCTPAAHAACNQGAYASSSGDYVVVVPLPDPPLRVSAICFATVVAAALPMPAPR